MSNLPAPIDPNLLPAYHEGARAAYSQDLFLVEASLTLLASPDFVAAVPADHALLLHLQQGGGIRAVTEGGTPIGEVDCPGLAILERLLEGGKNLRGGFVPPQQVGIWLQDL